jgi:hypothetical protein
MHRTATAALVLVAGLVSASCGAGHPTDAQILTGYESWWHSGVRAGLGASENPMPLVEPIAAHAQDSGITQQTPNGVTYDVPIDLTFKATSPDAWIYRCDASHDDDNVPFQIASPRFRNNFQSPERFLPLAQGQEFTCSWPGHFTKVQEGWLMQNTGFSTTTLLK